MQLARALVLVAVIAGAAHADGDIALRGVYYKEHATRVEQPMIDARFDAGEGGTVDAHFLADVITSASAGAGAAGSAFTEHRYELGGGYLKQLADQPWRLGFLARGSTESDYDSIFAAGRVERDLADKNFTLALTAGIGYDHITNALNPGTLGAIDQHLTPSLVSFAASQIVDPNTVASVTYDLAYYHGYLANPYRTVITADGLEPERMPGSRTRHAFAASLRHFFPSTETTVIAGYRFYIDDWGVLAHTPEVRVVQRAGDDLELGVGFRYYRQRAADFFKETYPTSDPKMEPFLTDDPKLSKFDGETISAKFGVLGRAFGFTGQWGDARAEVIFEYVVQHNRFGNAGIAHVALSVPLAY